MKDSQKINRSVYHTKSLLNLLTKGAKLDSASFVKSPEGTFDLMIRKFGFSVLIRLSNKTENISYSTLYRLVESIKTYTAEDFERNSLKNSKNERSKTN